MQFQRQHLADCLLCDDSDVPFLGAKANTVLSNYLWPKKFGAQTPKTKQPRVGKLISTKVRKDGKPDQPIRRNILASLLGTDYTQNLNIMT